MEEKEESQQPSPRSVVCAIDLTSASDTAVLTAARMVHPPDELHFVHATLSKRIGELRRLQEQEEMLASDPELMRKYFQSVCEQAELCPRVTPHFHARIGEPLEAILQFTVDVEADLLICGTHARHGMDRLVKGSVAEQLVREASCTVMVAREKHYGGARKSEMPAPICADCQAVRDESGDEAAWCEVHGREHVATRTYAGSETRGSSQSSFNIKT